MTPTIRSKTNWAPPPSDVAPGPKPPQPMTDRQRAIFEYIYQTARAHGRRPTYREIMARIGSNHVSGVQCHIKALVKKRWLGLQEEDRPMTPTNLVFRYRPDGRLFTGFVDPPLTKPIPPRWSAR